MYAHKTRGEQRPRLLVIDDDDAIAALAERIFSSVFDVSASATGIEGVLRAVEESPDIILLDFELPDMSGVDVTRDLRNRRETALIPIIMITGHGDSEDRKTLELESLAAGVDDYVSKPFDAKALTLRVANLLSRAGARR